MGLYLLLYMYNGYISSRAKKPIGLESVAPVALATAATIQEMEQAKDVAFRVMDALLQSKEEAIAVKNALLQAKDAEIQRLQAEVAESKRQSGKRRSDRDDEPALAPAPLLSRHQQVQGNRTPPQPHLAFPMQLHVMNPSLIRRRRVMTRWSVRLRQAICN